jgi:hypothetical protein
MTGQDTRIIINCIGLHVKYSSFLPDLNKIANMFNPNVSYEDVAVWTFSPELSRLSVQANENSPRTRRDESKILNVTVLTGLDLRNSVQVTFYRD